MIHPVASVRRGTDAATAPPGETTLVLLARGFGVSRHYFGVSTTTGIGRDVFF